MLSSRLRTVSTCKYCVQIVSVGIYVLLLIAYCKYMYVSTVYCTDCISTASRTGIYVYILLYCETSGLLHSTLANSVTRQLKRNA